MLCYSKYQSKTDSMETSFLQYISQRGEIISDDCVLIIETLVSTDHSLVFYDYRSTVPGREEISEPSKAGTSKLDWRCFEYY